MVAVTNGRIVTVIRHHDQAIIWLHRLNKPGKVTVNDLQTFGITCDVFCMTSEVGFLDIGTNKRRRIGVKFVEGDIHNPLAIHQVLPAHAIRIADDICHLTHQHGWHARFIQFLRHLHFFIDTVAHMYDLETVVIGARTRRIDANKAPFFAFCGIEDALAVG